MVSLSKRLNAVASLVESGSSVADVGTDHGYIPVYLVENKISPFVVAMDINEKPLASCKSLVKNEGFEDVILTRLSNGLEKLDSGECDTVIIAGMGAELIVDILSKCDFVNELHLILQPMTLPKDYFLGNITDFSQKEYFLHLLNYLKNKSKSGADLSDVISAVEEIL